VIGNSEQGLDDAIIVEVRLSDDALSQRIRDWINGSSAFLLGAAGATRSVMVADHLPDDADAPVVLLESDGDATSWPREPRVAARLTLPLDFVKLRIAIEAAAHGMSVTDTAKQLSPANGESVILTNREKEVLQLLGEGASNKIIARSLGISGHTVKFHVASLLEKLGAASRTEAVMTAVRLGLFML
jgi:DNA-binding NarL/FixJ family response regulator